MFRSPVCDRGSNPCTLSRMNDFLGGLFALAFLAGVLSYVGPLVADILGHIF
jgi:hypothetical protein